MDTLELNKHLGLAYATAVLSGDRPKAVAALRETVSASPEARAAAEQHRSIAAATLRVRAYGGQDCCHVTRFARDILDEVLA